MNVKLFLILIYILELVYLLAGMKGLFETKIIRKWTFPVFFIGYIVLLFFLPVNFDEKMTGYIGMIGFLLIYGNCLITIRSEKNWSFKWLIYRFFILAYIDELLSMCIGNCLKLCKVDTSGYAIYLPINMVNMIIMIVLIFFCKRYNWTSFSIDYTTKFRKRLVPLLVFFAVEIMFMATGLEVWLEERTDLPSQLFAMLLGMLAMVSIGAFVLIVLYVKKSSEKMEALLVKERQLIKFQKDYYTTLLEKDIATRKYRHDMNSHLICLRQLAINEDMNGVKEYIKQMNDSLQEICSLAYRTGINVLDVFINHYCMYVDNYTKISVSGGCSGQMKISDADQCTIFSNLIRNAMEALEYVKEPVKYLKINVDEKEEQVIITFINSFNPAQVYTNKNGKLQTTKNDKKNHGMGIMNAEETINKNNGNIYFYIKNNLFCCEIRLPKQCKQQSFSWKNE